MATMDPLHRLRGGGHSKSIKSLKRANVRVTSPLSSPPMCATPINEVHNTFETSLDHLITLPRRIDEPLVSFLLRSIFKFPLVFQSVQSSVTSLCQDTNMHEFMEIYGPDEGEALVFVAFLYAMGQDIQKQHSIEAPNQLPHDITFREAIGIMHLAELFDLDSLRHVARVAVHDIFLRPIPQSEYAWIFGRGSRLAGPLCLEPDVPVKIALVDHFTHYWDDEQSPQEEQAFLKLGRDNIEFYLLVKSFCLGHVDERGANDISPIFLSKWINSVRRKSLSRGKAYDHTNPIYQHPPEQPELCDKTSVEQQQVPPPVTATIHPQSPEQPKSCEKETTEQQVSPQAIS